MRQLHVINGNVHHVIMCYYIWSKAGGVPSMITVILNGNEFLIEVMVYYQATLLWVIIENNCDRCTIANACVGAHTKSTHTQIDNVVPLQMHPKHIH